MSGKYFMLMFEGEDGCFLCDDTLILEVMFFFIVSLSSADIVPLLLLCYYYRSGWSPLINETSETSERPNTC